MAGLYIHVPKKFEEHFDYDRLEESLTRLMADAHRLAGNYEKETAAMLIAVFKNATPVPDIPDAEDSAALHNIKEAHINLCDSCEHLFPECPAGRDDALFGNYDNVCACAKYRCGVNEASC